MNEHDQPLVCRSIQEQGLYLLVRSCDKCQAGPLEEISCTQTQAPTGPIHRVTVRCPNCDQEIVLEFSQSADNTRTSKSQLIDVAEWLGLCHHFLDLAQTDSSSEDAHEQIITARYCLNEAIRFYPEDSRLPPPTAFFGRLGDRRFKEHPAVFLKTKLLELRRRIPTLIKQTVEPAPESPSKKRKWWRTE